MTGSDRRGPGGWSRVMRRYVSAQLLWGHWVAQQAGLSTSEFAAINLIALEGPVTVGELGRLTALSTGAATRMVDRLERRGFVTRRQDPDDHRRVLVDHSPAAGEVLSGLVQSHRDAAGAVLGELSEEQRGAVLRYLELMGPALRTATQAPAAGR